MPLTRDEADALARLCAHLRPAWNYPGVYKQLAALAHHPAPAAVLCQVAIRAAADPDHVHTPAVIPMDGPHWNLTDAPAPKPVRLTADHECKQHAGQWAGNCGLCTSEKLGGQAWYDLETADRPNAPERDALDGYDPAAATIGAWAREEARRIARQTNIARTQTPDGEPAKTSTDPVG